MSIEDAREIERIVAENEVWRAACINLIASENVLSRRARAMLSSDFGHRYAEGHPGKRYYEGTAFIDELESRAAAGVREIFGAANADVRPYSGNVANEALFSRFIRDERPVMVNSTPGGGHISHHKAGSVGKFAKKIVDFPRSPDGYTIDVAAARDLIDAEKPGLLILGKSLILRREPVADLAQICKARGIRLFYDGAHVLGLIAGGAFQDPLAEGADFLTGSTHKTFFGPQRGVILSNHEDEMWKLADRGVFPGSTSNHHLNTLAAFSLVVEEWKSFGKDYARQVVSNAKSFAEALASEGLDVQGKEFGYTETHQVAVSVRDFGGGKDVSRRLAENNIITNMNMLPYEPLKNAMNPDGIRTGVQEMTRFGMKGAEMKTIAGLFARCVKGEMVRNEVAEFRTQFQAVRFSFDEPK
ncbi:serine hydroxymethyltransferase [bacterium]|nr:serine hydroxymethyltransferase [bacterium]